jgi:restriction endonuclease Mrr
MDAEILKKIENTLIAHFHEHGATKRDALFQVVIDALKLPKKELTNFLADKSSGSRYNKVRALTGSIINDLLKAGSIKLPIENKSINKVATVKISKLSVDEEYVERKKIIFEYLSAKYLTDEEKKDKTKTAKLNILKSIINDKNKRQIILDGTIDNARDAVEKTFISAAKINQQATKLSENVTFPNTIIGNFLRNEYDYYLKYINQKISLDDYEKRLDSAMFEALQKNGGEFFEIFCLDIVKAVYGEKRIVPDTTKNIGGSDDHGIDSVMIILDEFGMNDKLVIQSKLGECGEKAIREFAGSMTFADAQKGIFITAKEIDTKARKFVESTPGIARKLTLLGKKELLPLIKKHSIGLVKDKNGFPMLDKTYYIIQLD